MKQKAQRALDRRRSMYKVIWPPNGQRERIEALLRPMTSLRTTSPWRGIPTALFEVEADKAAGIRHRFGIPAGQENYVINQLRTAVANGHVTPELPVDRQKRRVHWQYAEELVLSTQTKQLNTASPDTWVAAILASFGSLKEGETLLYQVIIAANAHQPLPSRETDKTAWPFTPLYRSKDAIDAHRQKVADVTFQATIRIAARGANREDARRLVLRVRSALNSRSAHGVSFRRRRLPEPLILSLVNEGRVHSMRSVYSIDEMVPLLAIPLGEHQVPGLPGARSRHLLADSAIPSSGGLTVATANFPGAERPLNLRPADLMTHLHLLGASGSGKSTVMENLAVQAIQQGLGCTFLDPHGDSFRAVLDRISPNRLKDVIVLNLTDARNPVGFNVLEGDPYVVTNQVMAVFDQLYDIYRTPLTADILRSTVLTLAILGETLLDIMPVLDPTDAGQARRDRLMKKIKDPALLSFWREYSRQKPERKADVIAPLQRRLRPFETYPSLRGCLGQVKSGFNMDDVLASKKILLINLSKGQIGEEESKLFGSLFLPRFLSAVQRRSAIAAADRHPHLFLIDEFSNYVKLPTKFDTVLAECRKYGLGLVLAHQTLSQLPLDLREAMAANARSKMIFNSSASDAAALAREIPGIRAEDIQTLRQWEVIARLTVDSQTLPPASAVTLPPYPSLGSAQAARSHSAQAYGRSLAEVEAELLERRRLPPQAGPDHLSFREEDE